MEELYVRLPIRLGQFLKLANLAESGAHARELVEDGVVAVNGHVIYTRGTRLAAGDIVSLEGGPEVLVRAEQN